jgi:hypothetical protein
VQLDKRRHVEIRDGTLRVNEHNDTGLLVLKTVQRPAATVDIGQAEVGDGDLLILGDIARRFGDSLIAQLREKRGGDKNGER